MKKMLAALSAAALSLALIMSVTFSTPGHAGARKNMVDVNSNSFGQEIDTVDGMQKLAVFTAQPNLIYSTYGAASGTVQGIINTTHTAKNLLGITSCISPCASTDLTAYRWPLTISFTNNSPGWFEYQVRTFTATTNNLTSDTGIPIPPSSTVEVNLPLFPAPYTFQWKASGTGTTELGYRWEMRGRK